MATTWVDFRAVKEAVPILAVLQRYQVKGLKQSGNELRGRCPIHQGQGEESFSVNTEKNCFQCFSCKARGNVLDFVAAMEKCNVRDAAVKLGQWFGVSSAPATSEGKTRAGESSTIESANGSDIEPNKPLGFQLQGVLHDYLYFDERGITKETAAHFGAGFFTGRGSMFGRVVIPIHNEAGELVAYAGRSVDGAEPRYKLPAGFHKSRELYNLHRAIAATGHYRGLVVVEGFFDCMKVHQAGYPFVVALMGCSMSEEQERLLVAHADRVLLMLDGDEAGHKGTDEIMLRLGRRVWVKAISMADGQQPDSMTAEEIQAVWGK